ncbi:MAG: signal recognition particle receptor subunit alpha, partial [Bacteroidota bacterium]
MTKESVFQKLTAGLARTRDSLFGSVQRLVTARGTIDDEVLARLEEVFLAGDVGVRTTERLIGNITRRVRDEHYVSAEELNTLLKDEIARVLQVDGSSGPDERRLRSETGPFVILVVGVNGAGKTTTVGKLAHRFKVDGRKVLIAAADTYRAAANEQLDIWADRAGVEVVQQNRGSDPGAVAFDALSSAIANHVDVLIVDTAGRLHTSVNLMEELRK